MVTNSVDVKNLILDLAGEKRPKIISAMGPIKGDITQVSRRSIHQRLPLGDNGLLIWQLSSLLNDQGQVDPGAMSHKDELAELRNLRRQLPQSAVRIDDGILIAYSHASNRVGWLMEAYKDNYWWRRFGRYSRELSDMVRQRTVVARMLRYTGRFPRYVRIEEIFSTAARPKAVLYPYTLAMSDEDVEKAGRFIRDGGIVITVGPVGSFDDHGRGRSLTLPEALVPEKMRPVVSRIVSNAMKNNVDRKKEYGAVDIGKDDGELLKVYSDCLLSVRIGKGRLLCISNVEDAPVQPPPDYACAPPYARFIEYIDKALLEAGYEASLRIANAEDGLPAAEAYLWKDETGARWLTIGARMTDVEKMPPLIRGQVSAKGALVPRLSGLGVNDKGEVTVGVPGTYRSR